MRNVAPFVLGLLGMSLVIECAMGDEPMGLAELRLAKIEVARLWLDSAKASWTSSRSVEIHEAACSLRDSRIAVAQGKQERLAALREYLGEVELLYKQTDALNRMNTKGGDPAILLETRIYFLEAKIAFDQAEAGP